MPTCVPLLALLLVCGWSMPVYAHGTERSFGTSINSRRSAPAADEDPRGAEFTLLALATQLSALERDLGEEQTANVRERAQRLPIMARDLIARSRYLGVSERREVDRAARAIRQSALRMDAAAAGDERAGIIREIRRVREQIGAIESLLREVAGEPRSREP